MTLPTTFTIDAPGDAARAAGSLIGGLAGLALHTLE